MRPDGRDTQGAAGSASVPPVHVAHNKLVRDRIPEIIQCNGHRAVTRVLDSDEYRQQLLAKLVEEAQEAQAAPAVELPSESADVFETLQALTTAAGLTWDQLTAIAADKRSRRGGFRNRIYLEYVEE
jgi:predicted house-cleaning noncanonical NTP pyrophosphatase (MazG superfamily)